MKNPGSMLDPGPWRRAAWIVPVALVLGLIVHVFVLQRFPNSADEYAYLWQAETFASGRVTAAIPEPRAAFWFFHLGDKGGHRFSRFPPGWSLLLTPGVWAGLAGGVNPLLAALALAGIYRLGVAWVGERAARLGTLLTGLSPFFLLNAGSYHSHPACLFALTGLALALSWALERPGPLPALAAGASFGLAVSIRPYTALLLGVPLLAALGRSLWIDASRGPVTSSKRRPGTAARALFWFVVGGLPWALVLAFINERTTGNWLLLATRYLDPQEGLGFGVHGHTLRQGLQTTLLWGFETLGYTFFLSPLLLLAARKHAGPRARLLWIMLGAPVAGYLFYWNPGGNRYGPRFYFEALLPFTLLTGVGLERVLELRRYRLLVGTAAAIGLAALGRQCYDAWSQIHARLALQRIVESRQIHHAVVLLETGSADMPAYDLTRNPPDFRQADVLYAHAGEADSEIAATYPDRRLYYYHWDEAGGKLRPMTVLTIPGRP